MTGNNKKFENLKTFLDGAEKHGSFDAYKQALEIEQREKTIAELQIELELIKQKGAKEWEQEKWERDYQVELERRAIREKELKQQHEHALYMARYSRGEIDNENSYKKLFDEALEGWQKDIDELEELKKANEALLYLKSILECENDSLKNRIEKLREELRLCRESMGIVASFVRWLMG